MQKQKPRAPHLTTCGGGSIIAIASAAGLVGLPFLDPYVASKHGIVGLVKAFAIELAEKGIRVNAICPTGVSGTEITKHYNNNSRIFSEAPEKLQLTVANALQIDTVQMSDISSAVVYFASDTGRFITGIAIPVDAGLINL